jgi:uncharacterized membrane protein
MATAEGDYTGSTRGKVEDNSLGRLLTLSDGVFAIAMTLLALDLRVPELPDPVTNTALLDELGRELPSILTFLLSFYVVANYWFSHHRLMRSVTTTHPRLLRHTLPLLLVVAAMPFPTSLLGRYASVPIALALYGVVSVLAVLLLWLRHDDRWRCAGAPSGRLQPAHNFALSTATSTCPAKSRSPTTCRGRKCQCQAHNHSNVPAATAVSRRVAPPQRPRHFAQPPDHEVIISFPDLTGARVLAE